jgi:hypothetical protein
MSTSSPRSSIVLVLALVLAAAPARADDDEAPPPAPVNIIVTGGGAGAAERVARSIEAELDRAVILLAEDAPCPAPCAAIAIDGAHDAATVRVTSDAGELRQRSISIPRDPAGAAEVIALLVGNMAREEASALLHDFDDVGTDGDDGEGGEDAEPGEPVTTPDQVDDPVLDEGSPDGEAPGTAVVVEGADGGVVVASGDVVVAVGPGDAAPVAPGPEGFVAAEPEREGRTSLSIGLVPPIAIRFGGASRRGLSIQALVGWSREVHALSIAGIVDHVSGDVYGAQIAGAVAVAGKVRVVQIAGAVAVADRVDGVQIGGAVGKSGGGAGVQIAGAVGYAGGRAGTQIAGAVTSAGGGAGVQIAGAANVSGGSVGVQVAGAVNVADGHVYGAQIGVVNVAGTVDGVQIGVVNVAKKTNGGLSLGLINIVPGGRSELEATIDSDQVGAVMFRHGGRRWHNTYGVAGRATGGLLDSTLNDDDVFMYGFGFGPTFHLGNVTLDVDLVGWHVLYGDGTHGHADFLSQLRAVVAVPLGGIEVIGGVAGNAYITSDPARDGFAAKREEPGPGEMDPGVRVMFSPSAFVGVRL